MVAERVEWPDDVDEVIAGDLTAAAAYLTSGGGAVVTGVAPCGIRDRDRGLVGFTTSLGFAKKLERIITDPAVALAFHAREHGHSASPRFVLVQGMASVNLSPSLERLEALALEVEHYMGEVKRGPVWDRLLREYYRERVFVDITVQRVVAWPDPAAAGAPDVYGRPSAQPPPPQRAPKNGAGPRVDVERAAKQIAVLPHRVLAYRGADGLPVVVPVGIAGHDAAGLRLTTAPGVLPTGARRAGLLTHSYRPKLVGLSTRTFTGWLEVGGDGTAVYAPHTTRGFRAPPRKRLLLVSNGLLAKAGMWQARRTGTAQRLQALASEAEKKPVRAETSGH